MGEMRTKNESIDIDKGCAPPKPSPQMRSLVNSMLCKDFRKRLALKDVMTHPFFSSASEPAEFHASILLSFAKKSEKKDIYKAVMADVAAGQSLAQMRELNQLFMGIDSDGDGIITADEVRACLS